MNFKSPEAPNIMQTRVNKSPNTLYKFKICLVGDGDTGKTTFINKVISEYHVIEDVDIHVTQGAEITFLTLSIGDSSQVKYEVWDTVGQEKSVELTDEYYVGAVAGFIFCDVNNRETMLNATKHVKKFTGACGVENPLIFVLVNKVDIARAKFDITKLTTIFRSYDVEVILISAKTGLNFKKPFEMLTKRLFNDSNLNIDMTL